MSIVQETEPAGVRGEPARIIAHEDDYCLAYWRSFFIIVWRRETPIEGIKRLRRGLASLSAEHPNGIALFTIVEPRAPAPSAEARDLLANVLADFGRSIRFSAVAFEGTGFRAALVRGVVTGLTLLARMPYPHKVFPGVESAADWIVGRLRGELGWSVSLPELVAVVAELRTRIDAR